MALELYIHPCIHDPAHALHPPPLGKPLRIQIQGPLQSIQKLFPDVQWLTKNFITSFPQPAGPRLAHATFRALYGCAAGVGDIVIRDEYLAWVIEEKRPLDYLDYYGVTFDYLVPNDDINPEVLAISLIEVDDDGGAFADEVLPFKIDCSDYTGKKVLAVPRCCQHKRGTQDRMRINGLVNEREERQVMTEKGITLKDPC